MYMCNIWISCIIIVLSILNADHVIGQTNHVISGTRFNITIDFNPKDTSIFWRRAGTTLRDARFDTATGSGCRSPVSTAAPRFIFYCEDNGGRYILELDSSDVDQGVIYTTDPREKDFQYAVIDQDHTTAITYDIPPKLNGSININCTVACTPSDTSITVYVKQKDGTQYQLETPTPDRDDCSAIGFQTITVTSNVTLQFLQWQNITGSFDIVFTISYRGESITSDTFAIEIASADTTSNSTNTTQSGTNNEVTDWGPIAGGVVGGVLGVATIGVVTYLIKIKKTTGGTTGLPLKTAQTGNIENANNTGLPESKSAPKIGQTQESPKKMNAKRN